MDGVDVSGDWTDRTKLPPGGPTYPGLDAVSAELAWLDSHHHGICGSSLPFQPHGPSQLIISPSCLISLRSALVLRVSITTANQTGLAYRMQYAVHPFFSRRFFNRQNICTPFPQLVESGKPPAWRHFRSQPLWPLPLHSFIFCPVGCRLSFI
jgi:hypothetical protein